MKKKICLMSFMLMGFVSLFTSCVEGDLYELYDDGTEFMSPRRKRAKDYGGGVNPNAQYAHLPSKSDIYGSSVVQAHFSSLWDQAVDYCSGGEWGELSCWIFWSAERGYYFIDGTGEKKGYNQTVHAACPTIPKEDRPNLCGYFHTHPRIEDAAAWAVRDVVGPSQLDRKLASDWGLPCFVYDYASPTKKFNDQGISGEVSSYGPNKRCVPGSN